MEAVTIPNMQPNHNIYAYAQSSVHPNQLVSTTFFLSRDLAGQLEILDNIQSM